MHEQSENYRAVCVQGCSRKGALPGEPLPLTRYLQRKPLPYISFVKAHYAFYIAWDDAGTLLSLIHGTLMQAILEQESRIAGFKGEVAKSQELHLASLSRDTERLTNSLEKMRAEIKWASRLCILLMYPNSFMSVCGTHACPGDNEDARWALSPALPSAQRWIRGCRACDAITS